ncbi:MAG TPA: ABC transporter permease [Longimicrobiales bacterium]
MDTILRDVRFGLKLLLRDRTFSLTVLLTLGVCIGANVAIYSVVETVVLSPLPFEQPDRLVTIYNSYPGAGAERGDNSAPDFFFRRERVAGLEEVALFQGSASTVGEAGRVERVRSLRVTPSFFPMLGVRAARGRTFLEEEMDPGREPTVILTHGYWQERFAGSPDVVGRSLRIDGVPTTIIGVLPEDFRMPQHPDIGFVLPLTFTPEQRTLHDWHSNSYAMLGRLAAGATIEQVEAQIAALNASLIEEVPLPNVAQLLADVGFHTVVVDARDDLVRDVEPVLFLLWGGVGFVLLIGCVNIANLMLARSQARMRELATRMALGAQRARLARQILTEAVVMGLLGGGVGIGLAAVGLRLLTVVGVDELPRGAEIGLNLAVLLYTVALALAAAVLFGAIPIVHLFRSDLNRVFREEGRGATASRAAVLLRGGLVAGQVALAFLLLVGAGLLLRSFRAALEVDPGFEPEGVLTAYIALPDARYPDGDARRAFADELLRRVRALPGVTAAGITDQLPFGSTHNNSAIRPADYEPPPGESILAPKSTTAGPGYFEAMGIDLVEGRTFDERDGPGDTRAIIIDEWLARRYWPDRSPLGQRMTQAVPGEAADDEDLYTIIGVVETIKHEDLTAAASDHVGAYYFSYRQRSVGSMALVVRTEAEPASLTGSIRAVLDRLDPELALFDVQALESRLAESLASRRTPMVLLLVFAGVALFLAITGIYGVLAYSVAQRTREIGIRMALGIPPTGAIQLVLRQGMTLTGAGLAAGAVAAFFLVRLIQSLLFGVRPMDPVVLVATAALLAVAAAAACMIPARRASRVDPVIALSQG